MSNSLLKKSQRRKAPEEADIFAGSQLCLARKSRKMSQERLGEHLSVSFQQVQKYEKGKNRMTPGILAAAADILGVSPAFFFKNTGGRSAEPTAETLQLATLMSSKDALELNALFARIDDPKLRHHILGCMRQVVEAFGPRLDRPKGFTEKVSSGFPFGNA